MSYNKLEIRERASNVRMANHNMTLLNNQNLKCTKKEV
jgi:hypothetical protein